MAQRILVYGERRGPASNAAGRLVESGFVVDFADEAAGVRRRLQTEPRPLVVTATSTTAAKRRLTALRWSTVVPIIAVVPDAGGPEVATLLGMGAAAVLSADLSKRELAARLTAALRMHARGSRRAHGDATNKIGGLVVDEPRHSVTAAGRPVSLSPTEFRLLSALARRAGRVATNNELIEEVWDAEAPRGDKMLRLYVSYLRRKLSAVREHRVVLVNQRGVGYRLVEAVAS